jgi:hypothetical protein
MNRRSFSRLAALALAPLACAAPLGGASAQRPSRPIYRPLPGRPGRPVFPGRFYGGANYGAAAGVFVVASVNTRDGLLRLRDLDGGTAEVYVSHRLFDLDTLQAGDEVAVDFFVPDDNDDRLEAANIYKVERVPE